MDVAFLGLGNLGRAIARRIKNVFGDKINLYVWSRNYAKVENFSSETLSIPLRNLSSIPGDVEIIFMCLFDSEAVQSVLEKINGEGKIIVDFTTNHPDKAIEFSKTLRERGGTYIESPVLGSVIPANEGKLTTLVAGEEIAYRRIEDFIKAISSKIFYFGDNIPVASKFKLVNNLVLGGFMAVISEALAIGEKLNLPNDTLIDVLSHGAGRSSILEAKRSKLLNKDFSPHFSISLIRKDLEYLKDIASLGNLSSKMFLSLQLYDLYNKAREKGLAQLDFSSIYLMFKKILNECEKQEQ